MKHPARRAIALAAIWLSTAIGGSALASTVSFSDTVFDMANYSAQIAASAGVSTTGPVQTTQGNGDAAAAQGTFSNSTNPFFYVLFGLLRTGFNYDPASNGPLQSINVSLDRYFDPVIDDNHVLVGNFSLRTFIVQDSKIYQSVRIYNGGAGATWRNLNTATDPLGPLTAADFGLYDFATDTLVAGSNPDFSEAISAFGFGMRATGAGCPLQALTCTNTGTLRADNWMLTLTTADAVTVPEPGSMALISLGLAGIAASRRRRRPALLPA